MKSYIKEPKTQKEKKVKYPYIGISTSGRIVLFCEKASGMIIGFKDKSTSCVNDKIGEYSSSWVEENFTPFEGKVILEN